MKGGTKATAIEINDKGKPTTDFNKNGTMNLKFKIKGIPKFNGSPIPKIAGPIPSLPNSLNCFDLALNNNKHKAI